MKRYNYIFSFVFAAALFAASPAMAETLSDDEAYSRAYTVCSQKVFPLWRPKEGEVVNKDDYARTPPRMKKIASCMQEKGVPAAYSEETESVVRTGSGFGQNVDIKIEDLFPTDIAEPKENPHKANRQILPDPDYSRAADAPLPPDAEDIRVGAVPEGYDAEGGAYDANDDNSRRTEPPRRGTETNRPPPRSGDIGIITGSGNDSNGDSDKGSQPIFLPR